MVGAIIDCPEKVPLSKTGEIVRRHIIAIHQHYPAVLVDHYVIMPNHIHLLLVINADASGRSMIAPTISTVVKMLKDAVSKSVGHAIWQKSFFDHVIRNEKDYQRVWTYIENNPIKWTEDCFYAP